MQQTVKITCFWQINLPHADQRFFGDQGRSVSERLVESFSGARHDSHRTQYTQVLTEPRLGETEAQPKAYHGFHGRDFRSTIGP